MYQNMELLLYAFMLLYGNIMLDENKRLQGGEILELENMEIRKLLFDKGIRHYILADAIGIAPCTLGIWLRRPLSQEHRERIMYAIEKLTRKE